nr:unnamed protein product [Callosobruchus analis]
MSGERELPAEDSIKVVCRFRPLNDSEEKAGSKFVVKFPQGGDDNCISIAYCSHVYRCSLKHSFKLLDSIKKRAVRLIDVPNLIVDCYSLEHRRRVAVLFLYYRFYHGRCSYELSQKITLKAIRLKNTRDALRAHPYQVQVSIGLLQHSPLWRTSMRWNELPGKLFPDDRGYTLILSQ